MKEDARKARQGRIEAAAYELLESRGYAGTSMLAIAKAARCSNETLYNWYGDKAGLMRNLVARNADRARDLLQQALAQGHSPQETLTRFGPLLLDILLGDRAVALNRAAAADPTGELGQALAEAGRETIVPLLERLFAAADIRGEAGFPDSSAAVELYLGLLLGDLQIRRVIGRIPAPDAEMRERRAADALRRFRILAQSDLHG